MSDTQYDFIRDALPEFAHSVEVLAEYVCSIPQERRAGYLKKLDGMAVAAKALGVLSEADDFINEALRRAKGVSA